MNTCIFVGRLTADPELRQTDSGKLFCRFTLAVRRDENHTDFVPCVAFDATASFVTSWFNKGKMAAINAALRTDKYTDSEGKEKTSYSFLAKEVHFCGK